MEQKNEKRMIDLRKEQFLYTSFHREDGEQVIQMVFENTVVILSEKQLEKLMY